MEVVGIDPWSGSFEESRRPHQKLVGGMPEGNRPRQEASSRGEALAA